MNPARLRNDERELREYASTSGGRVVVLGFETQPWCAVLKLKIPCPADASFPRRRIEEVTLRINPQADHPVTKPEFFLSPVPFVPNVYESGRVCIGNDWGGTMALTTIVERIERFLVLDPVLSNPDSPANGSAAEWFRGLTASQRITLPTMRLVKTGAVGSSIRFL